MSQSTTIPTYSMALILPTLQLYGIKTLYNEPIYEGDLDGGDELQLQQPTNNHSYHPTIPSSQSHQQFSSSAQPNHTHSTINGKKSSADEWLNEAFRSSLYLHSTSKGHRTAGNTKAPPQWMSFDDNAGCGNASQGQQQQPTPTSNHWNGDRR